MEWKVVMSCDFHSDGSPSEGVRRSRRITPHTPFPRDISGSSLSIQDGWTASAISFNHTGTQRYAAYGQEGNRMDLRVLKALAVLRV